MCECDGISSETLNEKKKRIHDIGTCAMSGACACDVILDIHHLTLWVYGCASVTDFVLYTQFTDRKFAQRLNSNI